ncbi:Flp pilus assembly complex ATPase component TadA [Patescibacteria group bacterium]|nr:Flp pilus assembly complex ATPase component TadA [Patescibacteria group bacterium]MCG2702232.1 Flp pilus assembly complex ATPase component TadA [Candidatus Parcubacteria bacterium]MBU4210014.1 Flp pilus assembly complex ATPase component TadA [Patescibacteria group bacterium]MBU4264754.1 Flp pilus assembly complex ATPase component TadA [Patescibacteria group bacterium]MBU4390092.1 Flp pilus assembly complex ATPase component TadA [Patescibacteria group bacterium]
MKKYEETLYEILKKNKFLSSQDLEEAYKASKDLDRSLADTLVFRGLLSEEVLTRLVAESLNLPYVPLKNYLIPDEILDLIPENLARRYRMIPFEKTDKGLSLAMEDPQNFEALETAKRQVDLPVSVFFTSPADLARALNQYKRDIKKKFKDIITQNIKKAGSVTEKDTVEKLLKVATNLPVVKILDAILEYAAAENASDLHFETQSDSLIVRLRVDGVLSDVLILPKDIQPAIVARIKVLSNLKIDEHRVPQDGRFKFKVDEISIGIRVSIIPSFFGENIVLRLLPTSSRPLNLEELGLSAVSLEIVKRNIKKPNGMILVTGPTGSGKTTTLYSILNILNTIKVKICTIEDPVEYSMPRISQIQVNHKTGLDFNVGLRSLLRHDPDIIMVGEIRDTETANMAVHSALTGHLVLSTLHTNSAPGAIPRFLDMGTEGYLLSSTINIVIAQRLVRRICPACVGEFKPSQETLDHINKSLGKNFDKQKFYKGKGCEKCNQTGYRGRVGIYEVMEVNDEIRQLTLKMTNEEEIKKAAVKAGMVTMLQDGFDKIASGFTTIEEIFAATKE